MLWLIWLQHIIGPFQPVKYNTLTQYGRAVATSVDTFYLVNESSGGPMLPLSPYFPLHQFTPRSIRYPISTQEVVKTLVTHLEMQVFMGGTYFLVARMLVCPSIFIAEAIKNVFYTTTKRAMNNTAS
ncbi:hypothetical protein EVAR_2808_1 [Eumeta japonica]|uniref:Uncharacterized protein n=1 Tax=Eumeta variegata TaxID=151549 RepID=A0A4C1T2D1_EUMVA|nr:hypothetical protein EVAR_2808_1 [Eumeta japonica]